jgi:hypothetical protein
MFLRPFSSFARFLVATLLACVSLQLAAQDGNQKDSGMTATAPASAGPNAVTLAAVQRGALACASRVEQVSNYLDVGRGSGGLLMFTPGQADQQLFGLSLGLPMPNGNSAYVSASFAPHQANGCGATFDAVSYWPSPCEAVASQQFAQLKPARALRKDIAVLDGGLAMKVFLMRAGDSGCISIKKELVL